MKKQKINLFTYGLLVASILGSMLDRPSKALHQTTDQFTLEAQRWQHDDADKNEEEDDDDDDEEFMIIVTRFLFPEELRKPSAFR